MELSLLVTDGNPSWASEGVRTCCLGTAPARTWRLQMFDELPDHPHLPGRRLDSCPAHRDERESSQTLLVLGHSRHHVWLEG